jgi:hypothetical protein
VRVMPNTPCLVGEVRRDGVTWRARDGSERRRSHRNRRGGGASSASAPRRSRWARSARPRYRPHTRADAAHTDRRSPEPLRWNRRAAEADRATVETLLGAVGVAMEACKGEEEEGPRRGGATVTCEW